MRVKLIAVLSAILVTPLGVAHAQTPAPTIDAVLAKYVASRGGKAKIAATHALRTAAHIKIGQATGTVTIDQARPGYMRMDMLIANNHFARGYDGSRAWQALIADTGGVQIMNALDTRNFAIESSFDGPLVDPASGKNKVSLIGREMMDGKNTYKVQVILAGGGGYIDYYYLDPVTYLPVVWQGNRLVNGQMLTFNTHFREYKSFGGLAFPVRVETTTNGTPPQATTVDSVIVNPTIDVKEFKPPVITRKKR